MESIDSGVKVDERERKSFSVVDIVLADIQIFDVTRV